ncbi:MULTISPECIES: hypothetical protein [unclassified Paenibacillus]|uniref:hypothetical protein n=1 Tax=unclassified Paenibacillus TaxID=185978 RepID=UPI00041B8CD4|nr:MULTISPECIES: hypothetical protein [unclassified Paenibacillus]KGP78172.1 hypothetical protein P364_0129980 [Paenibacillus sp. MAEPY2]KGP80822.1 hypothetical protein P363_0129520 [Paenibacillus sp. MAEPY1]
MKLFHGEEALIQEIDFLQPSISTPLGTIEFLLSVSSKSYLSTQCFRLKHGGSLYQYGYDLFDCELVICKPKLDLASHLTAEECWGAVFRIKPNKNHQIDTCSFSAYWREGYSWKDYGSNTGEDLEAIEYENEKYRLHLGTQDGPLLMARRNQGDRIPKSLALNSDFEKYGFIINSDKGIEVPMTRIQSHETCQVHFLTAWNRKIEEDVSTWLAVDLPSKQILEGKGLL